jgi:hypothetical protein
MFSVPPSSPSKAWKAKDLYLKTFFVDPCYANAYVGLFEDTKAPAGATRLLHAPTRYSTVFGHPNEYEFGGYALLDDVAGGIYRCRLQMHEGVLRSRRRNGAFDTWIINPDAEVLPPPTPGSRTRTVQVPKLMYVPPKGISLFIGKRLTPRELIEEVYPVLVEEEQVEDMEPFIRWMIACGSLASADDKASPCSLPDVTTPIGDAAFLKWKQTYIYRLVPTLQRTSPLQT